MDEGSASEITRSIPAVGAQFFPGQADRGHQIVQALVFEGGQTQALPDTLHHRQVLFGVGVGIHFDTAVRFPVRARGLFFGRRGQGWTGRSKS